MLSKFCKNIPNILTSVRFVVLPLVILGAFIDDITMRIIVLIVYSISAITDFLDGYIARHFNMFSNFGRIFDPISDKALVITTILMVIVRDAYLAKLLFIPFALIIMREILISGLREGLSEQQITIKVSILGKYKTAIQMFAIGFLISGNKIFPSWHLDIVGLTLLWVAAIITLITGLDYLIKSKSHIL